MGSQLLMGTCRTIQDAIDFIDIKDSVEGWKCLVRPFPFSFAIVPLYKVGVPEAEMVMMPAEWAFILHQFHKD